MAFHSLRILTIALDNEFDQTLINPGRVVRRFECAVGT